MEDTLSKQKVSEFIWQYFRFKPDSNREPGDVNEEKGVGYITEKLEMCSLSPVALHLTAY